MICMILGRPSAVGVLCVSLGDESKVMSWQRWVLQDTRWSSFAEGDAIDAQKWLAIVPSEPLNVEQVVLKALRPSYPCDYSLMFDLCVCLNTSLWDLQAFAPLVLSWFLVRCQETWHVSYYVQTWISLGHLLGWPMWLNPVRLQTSVRSCKEWHSDIGASRINPSMHVCWMYILESEWCGLICQLVYCVLIHVCSERNGAPDSEWQSVANAIVQAFRHIRYSGQ